MLRGPDPKPEHLRPMKMWFNHSEQEAVTEESERQAAGKKPDLDRVALWSTLEARMAEMESENLRPRLKSRFLRGARSMTFTL